MRIPAKGGFDLHELKGAGLQEISTYFTTAAKKIAMEFTSQATKNRSERTYSPWAILARLSAGLNDKDLELWQTWEQASRGRRAMAWSVGLRELLGLGRERLDAEIAESGEAGEVPLLFILKEGWAQLVRRPQLIPLVLEAAEGVSGVSLVDLLESEGIAYELV